MELSPYVEQLRQQLLATAAAGGPETQAVAEQLSISLDAATRVVLLEALAVAMSEVTSELAPASVDVRLRGRDPEFVVSAPDLDRSDGPRRQDDVTLDTRPDAEPDDGGTARITLRLAEHLKTRVEEAAGASGLSVNAWLVREVALAVERSGSGPPTRRIASGGSHVTGWAR
jgi:hypothetical protein